LNPDNLPLTITVINGPLHGTVVASSDGSIVYTPNLNFKGTDSFSYYLSSDSLQSNSATVTITVVPVNNAPVAVNDAYTTLEDTVLTISGPGVLLNDIDVDFDPLSAVMANGPFHGTVVLNSNGSFTYTPFANYNGPDSFTYNVTDGKLYGATPATVSITVLPVNDPPVAVDDFYQTSENVTLNVPPLGVLANDTDVDNDPLTAILVNGPLNASAFTLNANGSFTYTPNTNFFGTDVFTYRASDGQGGLSNVAKVTITILPVNQPPVAVDDFYTLTEDIPLQVAAPGVLINDTDADNNKLTAVLASGPAHGTLVLAGDGSFLYTPAANFNGSDTFTYRAYDGQSYSNLATVTLTILQADDAPVAVDDAYSTEENQTLVVPLPGILGNDYDIDSPSLVAVLVNPPQNGQLVISALGNFIYTPNAGYFGVDRFTYRAYDGSLFSNLATVTITVNQAVPTTIAMDPATDTGESNIDRITKDNSPGFLGTTIPGIRVNLFARLANTQTILTVGTTFADTNGNYIVESSPLPDGTYQFLVQGQRANGVQTALVDGGVVTIDTVAPRVLNALLNPKTGQVYVTYLDDRSGMSFSSTTNVANYVFTKQFTSTPRSDIISATRLLPVSQTGPQTVVLRSQQGKAIKHGRYLFRIISGGVADVAGNALDGEFTGTYPSGDGTAGGDFYGQFLNGGTYRRNAVAFPDFIPVLTLPDKLPQGPLAQVKNTKKK
jgi:VCBS repeat-containing protein